MKLIPLLFFTLLAFSPAVSAASRAELDIPRRTTTELIERYNNALAQQSHSTKPVAIEVTMEGRIPKLKKEGKLSALRRISSLGKVTYKLLGFQGDDLVKREVIARYLTAEQDNNRKGPEEKLDISITPENYKFNYKGVERRADRQVHVFELKPRHKRVGLFKGELWLDPETCLPLHEHGRLVKTPSIFVKRMDFVRDYEIKDGVSMLKHMQATTDTRIVGKAELAIDFAQAQPDPASEESSEEATRR